MGSPIIKKLWVILDVQTTIQSELMPTEKVQIAIQKIRDSEIKRYFLWTDGFSDWVSLAAYLMSPQNQYFIKAGKDFSMDDKNDLPAFTQKNIEFSSADFHLPQDSVVTEHAGNPSNFTPPTEDTTIDGMKSSKDIQLNPVTNIVNINFKNETYIDVHIFHDKKIIYSDRTANLNEKECFTSKKLPQEFSKRPLQILLINKRAHISIHKKINVEGMIVTDSGQKRIVFLNSSKLMRQNLQNFINCFYNQELATPKAS